MASRKRSSTCARCMSLLWRPASQTRGSWQERSAKKTRCYGNRESLPKGLTFAALSAHNIFELAVCMFAYTHACWLAFIRKISTYIQTYTHKYQHQGTLRSWRYCAIPYYHTLPRPTLAYHTILSYYHTMPCHTIPYIRIRTCTCTHPHHST